MRVQRAPRAVIIRPFPSRSPADISLARDCANMGYRWHWTEQGDSTGWAKGEERGLGREVLPKCALVSILTRSHQEEGSICLKEKTRQSREAT